MEKYQRTPDHNATLEDLQHNRKKALELVKTHSPDLQKLIRIQVTKNLHIFVTKEKLDKYGEQHYIDKYKHNSTSIWSYM